MRGSFAARFGAVAASASGDHAFVARSIRFMPEPSPGSIAAVAPVSREASHELIRWTRSVAAYAAGSSSANFRICGPVNRSKAREPVRRASTRGPPIARSIAWHWLVVLESIQIGDVRRENTSPSWSASGRAGSSDPRRCRAFSFTYTLPCCCAEPDIARKRLQSMPASRTRSEMIRSSPSDHISGGACAVRGSAERSTPCSVP